ncbi:MAG: calcineurin-like phosphoesterase C-terminal domain-containing protein [Beijerinckiaceae bacterium]
MVTRRQILRAGAGALASCAAPASTRADRSAETARGRVVEVLKGATRGIGGVLVSNGLEVVRSDAEGGYTLPARDGVFVVKPAHWTVPLDIRTGVPCFYYTHKPTGSPEGLKHGGLKATGPLPSSIDFVLERAPELKFFSAALFADPQPANHQELSFLRRTMDKMCARQDFAFGLALGDIASDNLHVYQDYQKETARLGAPVWHIPGNHDHDYDAPDVHSRLDTWRARFGPPTYAFEYAGALFVMLDNVSVRADGSYAGEIGPHGLAFVRNLLDFTPRDKLVVVCTHIPLTSSYSDDPSCTTSDRHALLNLLAGRRAVSFAGHMHTSEHHYLPAVSGSHHHQVVSALSGSWWSGPFDSTGQPLAISSDGTPHGWHVLSVDGADYHTEFVPAREEAIARVIVGGAARVAISDAPLEVVHGAPSPFGLMLNVFEGGPRTSVFVDLDGERHALRRVHEKDPYTEALFRTAGETLKYWVRAEASSHIWALEAPGVPPAVLARARLTIVDEYGRSRLEGAPLFQS